jgi:hypothetical protein
MHSCARVLYVTLLGAAMCKSVTACASATSTSAADADPFRRTTIFDVPQARMMFKDPQAPAEESFDVSKEDAVYGVKRVMMQLEIPITLEDSTTTTIGNRMFSKIYRIGETPMMQLFDCGYMSQGPRAATYRMYLSLVTRIERLEGRSTRVKITTVAHAQDPATPGLKVPCGSSGGLEKMVLDGVRSVGNETRPRASQSIHQP